MWRCIRCSTATLSMRVDYRAPVDSSTMTLGSRHNDTRHNDTRTDTRHNDTRTGTRHNDTRTDTVGDMSAGPLCLLL